MKHGDPQHRQAWVKHVANSLGFNDLPNDLQSQAETLYERGWTAPEVIHYLRQLLDIQKERKK